MWRWVSTRTRRLCCFRSPLFQYFPAYLTAAVNHFNELWTKADSMAEFIENLQDAVDYTESNIDYESSWLAIYEYALPQEDEELKTTIEPCESGGGPTEGDQNQAVEITRYLDIGTCTGRYPIQLRSWVTPNGKDSRR